jgi:hypothetical protein
VKKENGKEERLKTDSLNSGAAKTIRKSSGLNLCTVNAARGMSALVTSASVT